VEVSENVSWYIRKIKPEEEEAFINFLSAWVSDVPVADRYRWLYQGNPHGKAIIWLAVDEKTEEIAACKSSFPKLMRMNGEVVLGCVGGDMYVDPRWRRKGIAAALHLRTRAEMKDLGISLQYGFPLPENFGADLKTGARHPGNFFSAGLHLSSQPFLRKMKLGSLLPRKLQQVLDLAMVRALGLMPSRKTDGDYSIRQINSFDQAFEEVEEDISSSFSICCVRDLPYLQWRFFDNPFKACTVLGFEGKDARLQGYVALEAVGNTTVIRDFFIKPHEEFVKGLLRAVVKFAVSQGSQSIVMMINPEESLGKSLLNFGFRLLRANPVPLAVHTDLTDNGLDHIRNWHLTSADSDV
jgi:GNAT superfamily N-acetyltransferase